MNAAHRLAELPSNSTVASTVTLLVSGWFLLASGAILADPASPYTQRAQPQTVPAPQFARAADARLATITVEGHRTADVRLATLTVEGRRTADVRLATLTVEGHRTADARLATLTVEGRRLPGVQPVAATIEARRLQAQTL
jgi:hypothetical protein